MSDVIKYEEVESKVLTIRNEQVIIDRDVAAMYGVDTRRVNEAVARNLDKFPDGYIFVLDKDEKEEVVANCDHLGAIKFSLDINIESVIFCFPCCLKFSQATHFS